MDIVQIGAVIVIQLGRSCCHVFDVLKQELNIHLENVFDEGLVEPKLSDGLGCLASSRPK